MNYMWIVWIAVLVSAVVIEAFTSELVAIWFFPAAVLVLILDLAIGEEKFLPVWQVLVFLVTGLALVAATRPICRKWLKKGKETKTNAEAMVGRECIVTQEIRNIDEVGEVRVGGLCWSARTEDDSIVAVGEHVVVTEIRGVKLIVKQVQQNEEKGE